MDRRQFLLRAPPSVVGAAVSTKAVGPWSDHNTLGVQDETTLLEDASHHLRQLFEIAQRWHRHPDAQLTAQAALECLAEIWCRRRGMPAEPGRTHWQHLAMRRPDDVTGVPWRAADEAVERLADVANGLVPWRQKAMITSGDVDYTRIAASRRDVDAALAAVNECDTCVRI